MDEVYLRYYKPMLNPLVSVVVPCYNLERYIGDCISSLCRQVTDFSFEVIVCDDASTDNSYSVAKALQEQFPNLRVSRNQANQGLVKTMGRLFSECKGELIAYVDGDDLALPGKLQVLASVLTNDQHVNLVYHEMEVFNSDTGQVTSHYRRDFYNTKYLRLVSEPRDLLLYGIFMQASSVMFRRHSGLTEVLDHGCKIICDYPLHLGNAYSLGGCIQFVDRVLGRYRLHSSSFGAQTLKSSARRQQVTNDLLLAADHAHKFGANPDDILKSKIHSHFAAALYFLKAKENPPFIESIERAEQLSKQINWWFDDRQRSLFERRHEENNNSLAYFVGSDAL